MKNGEIVIYVPSYCLSLKDPSRLSHMSLETAKKGLEMMKKGIGDRIIFSTAYEWWETEAKLKRELAETYEVVGDDLVEIIPEMGDSYMEAERLKNLIDSETKIIIVAQKWHAPRVKKALSYFFKNIDLVKVKTKVERQLDPSWLKSVLCCSTILNFILWNWFFGLITPWMMRRQMRKKQRI